MFEADRLEFVRCLASKYELWPNSVVPQSNIASECVNLYSTSGNARFEQLRDTAENSGETLHVCAVCVHAGTAPTRCASLPRSPVVRSA